MHDHLAKVVAQMRAGGFYDRVMSGGAELDRVKDFLRACAGEASAAPCGSGQSPKYPCFPGLRHKPWHDAGDFAATGVLERNFAAIREEALALSEEARVDYSSVLRNNPQPRTWTVYLFYHLGIDVEPVAGACPRTLEVLRSLPRACTSYTWGDFVFSAMRGGTHLRPHFSIDNLRVRLHLGVTVPQDCSLRVGTEARTWSEGKCLAFEDSYEHEVWNRSASRRIVLIADLWHPDLADVEVRALSAAFGKSEVRRIFMGERIGMTDSPDRYLPFIDAALEREDQRPEIREFWPA